MQVQGHLCGRAKGKQGCQRKTIFKNLDYQIYGILLDRFGSMDALRRKGRLPDMPSVAVANKMPRLLEEKKQAQCQEET
jgi:hypothetical protein